MSREPWLYREISKKYGVDDSFNGAAKGANEDERSFLQEARIVIESVALTDNVLVRALEGDTRQPESITHYYMLIGLYSFPGGTICVSVSGAPWINCATIKITPNILIQDWIGRGRRGAYIRSSPSLLYDKFTGYSDAPLVYTERMVFAPWAGAHIYSDRRMNAKEIAREINDYIQFAIQHTPRLSHLLGWTWEQ